jgi:hypothetical protein
MGDSSANGLFVSILSSGDGQVNQNKSTASRNSRNFHGVQRIAVTALMARRLGFTENTALDGCTFSTYADALSGTLGGARRFAGKSRSTRLHTRSHTTGHH